MDITVFHRTNSSSFVFDITVKFCGESVIKLFSLNNREMNIWCFMIKRENLTPNVHPRFKTSNVSTLPSLSLLYVGIAEPDRII